MNFYTHCCLLLASSKNMLQCNLWEGQIEFSGKIAGFNSTLNKSLLTLWKCLSDLSMTKAKKKWRKKMFACLATSRLDLATFLVSDVSCNGIGCFFENFPLLWISDFFENEMPPMLQEIFLIKSVLCRVTHKIVLLSSFHKIKDKAKFSGNINFNNEIGYERRRMETWKDTGV